MLENHPEIDLAMRSHRKALGRNDAPRSQQKRKLRRARRGTVVFAVLLALGCAAEGARAQDATPLQGLVIQQVANGLPGASTAARVPQRLFVGGGFIRIDDERAGGRFVIVDLDGGFLREFDPRQQVYIQRNFVDLKRKRIEAEEEREAFVERMLEKHGEGRINDATLDAELKKRGARRDGKRELTTREQAGQTVGPYTTTSTAIAVNQKVYLQVWTTTALDGYEPPKELFDFYDKVGLFTDEVTTALRKIEGFPVRIHAELDYFTAAQTIESEVSSVMSIPIPKGTFDTPKHFKLVDRFPSEDGVATTDSGADPTATVHRCVVCDKVIEHPSIRGVGTRRFVCSKAHQRETALHPMKYRGK